jgi:hypothetical protein
MNIYCSIQYVKMYTYCSVNYSRVYTNLSVQYITMYTYCSVQYFTMNTYCSLQYVTIYTYCSLQRLTYRRNVRPITGQEVYRVIGIIIRDLSARRRCVVNTMSRPFYPNVRPSILCKGG